MVIKRKATKPQQRENAQIVINRGGKTVTESMETDEELRFTLRISKDLISEIDSERKAEIGKVSRNQWILGAIAEKLKQ